jgi:hypothetical protein
LIRWWGCTCPWSSLWSSPRPCYPPPSSRRRPRSFCLCLRSISTLKLANPASLLTAAWWGSREKERHCTHFTSDEDEREKTSYKETEGREKERHCTSWRGRERRQVIKRRRAEDTEKQCKHQIKK